MNKIAELRIKLRDRFIRLYTDDLVKISRRRQSNKNFKNRRPQMQPISSSQKEEIKSFWEPYRKLGKEIRWFDFYNAFCEDKRLLKYYIPESIFFSEIDTYFSSARRSEAIDDKTLYDIFFPDIKMPQTIVRKVNGELLDKDFMPISLQPVIELCLAAGRAVGKEAILSSGGHGIHFFDFSSGSADLFIGWLNSTDNVIVQHLIQQHETLNRLHNKSINSIRILSLLLDGKVHILSSFVRMGANGSIVDNTSSGGLACGINRDGMLKEHAYDRLGRSFTQHPQGAVFKDMQIPGYDKCCEQILSHAGRLCSVSRIISWDFAIDPDGNPVLIEVNLTYGGVNAHQMCNGPIFGEMTEEILSRVYHSESDK